MLRHAPWLYEMHYDGDFYVFFGHPRQKKNCFDFDDDALRWSQSPTSTTDAILDRFPQTTARWKALVKLEPIRPITGSVAVVAASASEWSVDSAPTIRALGSGSFFVANQVAWP